MALIFGFSRAFLVGLLVYLLVVACVWVHSRGAHARSSSAHST